MRWWVSGCIFTLLIALFTLVVWRQQKSGGACYEQRNARNTERPASRGADNSLITEKESPQQTYSPNSKSESYLCGLIVPANLPTDYLVIVGIGGVFVGIFTLNILERQTRSIHHQAVQVRKQTHILISKERARIGIDPVSLNFIDNFKRQNDPIPLEYDRIEFKVMCYGTTLASIMSAYTQVLLSKSAEVQDMGALKRPMSIPGKINPSLIGIDQIIPITDLADQIVKESDTVDKVETFLHFRAFVRYSDVFQTDKQWELECRYVWKITAFRRSIMITSVEYSRVEEEKETKKAN